MKFLVNPHSRKRSASRRRKRPIPKGYSSWSAYMDYVRSGGKKKGVTKMAKRKRSRKRSRKASPRRRRRSLRLFNPPTRRRRTHSRKRTHRRRYRHNPAFRLGNVPMLVFNGAVDAGEVVIGKALTRLVPQFLNLPRDGAMGLAVQILSALVVGWGGTFISPNASKMMLAGGFAAPVEDFLKTMNIPILGPALGEDVVEISAYPQNMSAYPGSGDLMGDVYDAAGAQQY